MQSIPSGPMSDNLGKQYGWGCPRHKHGSSHSSLSSPAWLGNNLQEASVHAVRCGSLERLQYISNSASACPAQQFCLCCLQSSAFMSRLRLLETHVAAQFLGASHHRNNKICMHAVRHHFISSLK